MRPWLLVSCVLALAGSPVAMAVAHAAGPSASSSDAPADPGMPSEELDRVLTPLGSADVEARKAAAKSVGELGPEAVPAIAKKLEALRKASTPQLQTIVKGTKVESGDLCDALVKSGGEGQPYVAAVQTAAMLRALAHVGTTPAVRQLVKVAAVQCGRAKRHPHLLHQIRDVAGDERDEERCPRDRAVDPRDLRRVRAQLVGDLCHGHVGAGAAGRDSPLLRGIGEPVDRVQGHALGQVLRVAVRNADESPGRGEDAADPPARGGVGGVVWFERTRFARLVS